MFTCINDTLHKKKYRCWLVWTSAFKQNIRRKFGPIIECVLITLCKCSSFTTCLQEETAQQTATPLCLLCSCFFLPIFKCCGFVHANKMAACITESFWMLHWKARYLLFLVMASTVELKIVCAVWLLYSFTPGNFHSWKLALHTIGPSLPAKERGCWMFC